MKPDNEYAGSPKDISDLEKEAGNEWTLSGDIQVWELLRDNIELKRRLRIAEGHLRAISIRLGDWQ